MAGIFVQGPCPIYVMGYQDEARQFDSPNGNPVNGVANGINIVASGGSRIPRPLSFIPNGQPQMLGIATEGVHLTFTPAFRPMMANIGGHSLPTSRFYDGQEAVVVAILTIHNWTLLELLSVRPNPNKPSAGTGVLTTISGSTDSFGQGNVTVDTVPDPLPPAVFPGIDEANAIGQPLTESGSAVHLLIRFPYQAKRQFASMVPGYRFFQTYLANKEIVGNPKASRIPVAFQCDRQYRANTGKWHLYDTDLSVLSPLNLGSQ